MPETLPAELGPRDWKTLFKKRREQAASDCAEIKRRAEENHRFAAPGEEQLPYEPDSSPATHARRRRRKFALMSNNEVHPMVSDMSGRQVLGRFERRYIPRKKSVRRWAEPLSNWDRGVVDACHADQEESAAFRNGPGIGGLSWLKVSIDYLDDPDGMIVVEEVPIWQMLWPARETRRKNLIDRDWHIHGFWMPLEEFRATWPEKWNEARQEIGRGGSWDAEGDQDAGGRIPWDSLKAADGRLSVFDRKERNLWVEHYEWREPAVRFYVAVPAEGLSYQAAVGTGGEYEVQEFSSEEYRDFVRSHREAFDEEIPPNRVLRKSRMVYYYAFMVGDIVLEKAESEVRRFTIEAMTGHSFVQPHQTDWRSVVDALRTPQIWVNIFLTTLVKYMQINPKGVLFTERGVFRSRADALSQFSSAGGVVEVERGKLSSPNPPYRFETGGSSPMGGFVSEMLQYASDFLPRSAGFNRGAMGQLGPDLRRVSGTVVEHVRDAMVASQGDLYDSYGLCRQRVGMILVSMLGILGIKHFQKIVGEEPFRDEIEDPMGQPVTDPAVLQALVAQGLLPQTSLEAIQDAPGEPFYVPVEPPEDLLDDAIWSVSVEETRPAPDRMRFFWESLTESGALKTLLETLAMTPEELVEIIPDLPEDLRKRMIERHRTQVPAVAPGQLPPAPGQPAPVEQAA